MTYTKTPPTKPGAYWWRVGYAPVVVRLLQVYLSKDGEPIACGHATHGDAELLGGEWSGPLVSAEEVEIAWGEGFYAGEKSNGTHLQPWLNSRARRVVEGEE